MALSAYPLVVLRTRPNMSAKLRCLFHLPCCLAAAALAFECTAGTVVGAEPLRLENAVVTLIEQVDVPARAPGCSPS